MRSDLQSRLQQVAHQMFSNWLTWGLLPLAACIVLTLLVQGIVGQLDVSERQLEIRFQIVFAIAAGLFLIGFSLDSHWTSAQKLARRLVKAAGLDQPEAAKMSQARTTEALIGQCNIVFNSILTSTFSLTIIGVAIGVTSILAAAVGLGLAYALMMLVLSISFQGFVFSRHAYYKEIMGAAAEGKLVVETKTAQPSKQRA